MGGSADHRSGAVVKRKRMGIPRVESLKRNNEQRGISDS